MVHETLTPTAAEPCASGTALPAGPLPAWICTAVSIALAASAAATSTPPSKDARYIGHCSTAGVGIERRARLSTHCIYTTQVDRRFESGGGGWEVFRTGASTWRPYRRAFNTTATDFFEREAADAAPMHQ